LRSATFSSPGDSTIDNDWLLGVVWDRFFTVGMFALVVISTALLIWVIFSIRMRQGAML
jgi:hypothetical protein